MDVDLDTHLSYPTAEPVVLPPSSSSSTSARPLLKERLYVGNLQPTVDEYTLIRLFQRYGKVTRLDFLFHKAGPQRGKPRGYAFVEYAHAEEATNALTATHDRLLRGRRLVVTHAQHAPADGGSYQHRSQHQPTALSIIKSAQARRNGDKIAQMEAKLRQMEADTVLNGPQPPAPTPRAPTSSEEGASSSSQPPSPHTTEQAYATHPLPLHPSLPAKPPPTLESVMAPREPVGDTSIHPTQQRPVQAKTTSGYVGLQTAHKPSPTSASGPPSSSSEAHHARPAPFQPTTGLHGLLGRPSLSSGTSSATVPPTRPFQGAVPTLKPLRPSPAATKPTPAPPAKKKQGLSGVKIVKKKT
uniref:Probable RNA-binding protein 18 n=2 Tax=Schizophyllum commune (strain H4-8 / FGSC 9210) TaxID=578458 RepID=D8QJT0_SCHCM